MKRARWIQRASSRWNSVVATAPRLTQREIAKTRTASGASQRENILQPLRRHGVQKVEKVGEGLCHAPWIAEANTGRAQRGDAEAHSHTVVVIGFDVCRLD